MKSSSPSAGHRHVPRVATLPRFPLGADGAPVVARRKRGRTIIIAHARSWRRSKAPRGGASLGDRRDIKDAAPRPSQGADVAAGCASREAGNGHSTMLMLNAGLVVVVVVVVVVVAFVIFFWICTLKGSWIPDCALKGSPILVVD